MDGPRIRQFSLYLISQILNTDSTHELGFMPNKWKTIKAALYHTRLFPDPRFLLFELQNIAGYKNAVKCLLQ